LTGSVSSVSGREIRENPSASLQNALAGKLPGFSHNNPLVVLVPMVQAFIFVG
jgi:hypothetical protein